MPRTGIMYDQVAAVADGLMAENIVPTNKNVRESLGTGSSGTIQRHLALWRETRPPLVGAQLELPKNIADVINQGIYRATSEARAEVENRLVVIQSEATELSEAVEELEAERDRHIEEIAALTAERVELRKKIAEQEKEIKQLSDDREREYNRAENAKTEVAQLRNKLETEKEKLVELADTVKELTLLSTSEVDRRITAEKEVAVLAEKFAAEHEKSASLRSDNEKLIVQISTERHSAEVARAESAIISTELANSSATLAQKLAEITYLSKSYETAQNAGLSAENTITALREQLAAKRQSVEAMRIDIAVMADRLSGFAAVIEQKDFAIEKITKEYAFERDARLDIENKFADMSMAIYAAGQGIKV